MSDIDELSPSGGYYAPEPPVAQVQKRDEELEAIAASIPVLEDVLKWFDELIAATESIDSIDLHHKIPAESQILAMQQLKKHALKQRKRFETRFTNYLKATG